MICLIQVGEAWVPSASVLVDGSILEEVPDVPLVGLVLESEDHVVCAYPFHNESLVVGFVVVIGRAILIVID